TAPKAISAKSVGTPPVMARMTLLDVTRASIEPAYPPEARRAVLPQQYRMISGCGEDEPTAHNSWLAGTRATSSRKPSTSGPKTTFQPEPFQCSSSGCLKLRVPTAHARVGEIPATPRSSADRCSWGVGLTVQSWPSQCTASGCRKPGFNPGVYPTAHASNGRRQL